MNEPQRSWRAWWQPSTTTRELLGTFTAIPSKACEVAMRRWPTAFASGFVRLERDPEDGSFEQRMAARG